MSAHLFLLPCLKFKLLVPLWFLLFSTISLHVRASAKGVRWRGQPVDSRTLAAPTEVLYAHTHIVSSECGEMHSEGWGGLIDWLSWGGLGCGKWSPWPCLIHCTAIWFLPSGNGLIHSESHTVDRPAFQFIYFSIFDVFLFLKSKIWWLEDKKTSVHVCLFVYIYT